MKLYVNIQTGHQWKILFTKKAKSGFFKEVTKDGIMTNKKKKIGVLLNHFLIKKEYFQSFLNY